MKQDSMTTIMDRINFSGCQLMLADDDPDDVIHVRHALEQANLNPPFWVARDGEEVVEFLSREDRLDARASQARATLLLLDLKMPRMDGFEVLEWIRRQPGLKTLIIVVLSSSRDERDVHRAYELGANSYLLKSGNLQEMAEQVKMLLTYWLFWNHPDQALLEGMEEPRAAESTLTLN